MALWKCEAGHWGRIRQVGDKQETGKIFIPAPAIVRGSELSLRKKEIPTMRRKRQTAWCTDYWGRGGRPGGGGGGKSFKVHTSAWYFYPMVFSSNILIWSPDSYPELFSNLNSISPRYLNLKLIPPITPICGFNCF
jgi:hypothetical protein